MYRCRTLLCLLLASVMCYGKETTSSPDTVQAGFDRLSARYRQGDGGDSAYISGFYKYVSSLQAKGVLFSDKELLDRMSVFRKIAWGRSQYRYAQRLYYALLSNQAQMAGRGGEMLYYAEKLSKVEEANKGRPSIAALTIRTDFYRSHGSYGKVKDIYAESRPYLLSLPALPAMQIGTDDLVQALIYLEKSCEATSRIPDTAVSEDIYRLMLRITGVIRLRRTGESIYEAYPRFCLALAMGNKSVAGKNEPGILLAQAQLDSLQRDPATPGTLRPYAQQLFLEMKLRYFMERKNADSLSYWLNVYMRRPEMGEDNETKSFVANIKTTICLIKGDAAGALVSQQEAAGLMNKFRAELLEEVDGMLYAHAEAEDNGIALAASEKAVRQQTILAVVVSIVSACVIAGLLVWFYRSRRRLSKQIRQLDDTVDMQIVSIEELKLAAQRDEQQRIGRELHDEWSPGLVSVMHQLGFMLQDTSDEAIKPALAQLRLQLADTYGSLRDFSHRLYDTGADADDGLFEMRIRTIVSQALPDGRFVKNILISDGTMRYIDPDTRIGLLRIIREAIINIIKHASAREVTIMLYEEAGNITLTISDDGKGFDVAGTRKRSAGKGLGLHSIRERAEILGGYLQIESGKEGTSVNVVFPVPEQHLY